MTRNDCEASEEYTGNSCETSTNAWCRDMGNINAMGTEQLAVSILSSSLPVCLLYCMYYIVLYLYCMYCMYLNPTHRVANKLVSLSLSLNNEIPVNETGCE